jgi:hypothetical protein
VSREVAKSAGSAAGCIYTFGLFRLFPSRRLLLEGNRKVQIGSRAFPRRDGLGTKCYSRRFRCDTDRCNKIVTVPRYGDDIVPEGLALAVPLQRTDPQRVAQLPWPTNMFGEPATIAELQAEVVQLSEYREFRRRRAND